VYENSTLLLNPQLLDLQVNRIRFVQKRLLPEPFGAKQNAAEKYEVYIEKEIAIGQLTLAIQSNVILKQDYDLYSPKTPVDPSFGQKNLLSASVLVSIKENVIQNSPMLIDQITKVFIPRVEILFPQDTYHIAKIISIVTQHSEPSKAFKKKGVYSARYYKITSLIKDVAPLLADIEKEHDYNNHGQSKKICRHCVLKYRKATSILQVIIGDYGNFNELIGAFELESIRIPGSQTGICIKLPISIDSQEIPLCIEIPFLMVIQEEGPFKDNLAVFTDKIESVNREKFSLKIKPYYALSNSDALFSPNFTKTLWKKFIDYHKCLTKTASGDELHLLNLFQESTLMSEIGDKSRSAMHLLFFRRSYNNKAMLAYLDGVQKTDVEALYKQSIISKFKFIHLESNDITAFASTFNIVTNIMLNSDLERFIEYLLRPIQATGLHKKKTVDELHKWQDEGNKAITIVERTDSDKEMEDQEDEEKAHIEEEVGPVIEYKEVITLRELFLQLMLDISVDNVDLKVNFDDKKSNVKIYMSFSSSMIRLNINTNRHQEHNNYSATTEGEPGSQSDNYVSVDNVKLDFGDNTLLVQQIALDYLPLKNSFDCRLGYFTVDNRSADTSLSQRIVQIGLDDIGMSKSLQYFALQTEISFDKDDSLKSRSVVTRHCDGRQAQ
jgi:hypothetical protein